MGADNGTAIAAHTRLLVECIHSYRQICHNALLLGEIMFRQVSFASKRVTLFCDPLQLTAQPLGVSLLVRHARSALGRLDGAIAAFDMIVAVSDGSSWD